MKYILYKLSRDHHVTGKFVLFVCKLFYRYLTTKIEFCQTGAFELFSSPTVGICIADIWTEASWGREVALEKNFTKKPELNI